LGEGGAEAAVEGARQCAHAGLDLVSRMLFVLIVVIFRWDRPGAHSVGTPARSSDGGVMAAFESTFWVEPTKGSLGAQVDRLLGACLVVE